MEQPKEIWATDLGMGYYEGTITKQYPNDIKYIRADIFEHLESKLKAKSYTEKDVETAYDKGFKDGIHFESNLTTK